MELNVNMVVRGGINTKANLRGLHPPGQFYVYNRTGGGGVSLV